MNEMEERDGFLFLAGQLALDFLNTCPLLDGHEHTELLPDGAAFIRWCYAAELIDTRQAKSLGLQATGKRGEALIEAVRQLRESLRDAIIGLENAKRVEPNFLIQVNDLLRLHPMLQRVEDVHHAIALQSWFDSSECENLIAPIAASIANLLTEVPRSRIHKCERCVLHFYDTSKNGTRRWCSMRLCGNRAKVAAYASRRRAKV